MTLACCKSKSNFAFTCWLGACPCRAGCRLAELDARVEGAVRHDFDWPGVFKTLFVAFLKDANAYTAHQGVEAHQLVLMNVVDELQSLLAIFGFGGSMSSAARDSPIELREGSRTASIIDEAIQFRSRVRNLGLKQMESGASKEASLLFLQLCDQFRQNLSLHHGISLLVLSQGWPCSKRCC